MTFARVTSPEPVVTFLAAILREQLGRGKKVFWLVPGGSAIAIVAKVSQALQGLDLSRLTVTLTDERYGEVGHSNANWQKLESAGLRLPDALLLPVLSGISAEETTQQFDENIKKSLMLSDFALGFFGLGADGHTAGILPYSQATVATNAYAVQYVGTDFHRITMTARAISQLDEAVVYAVGPEKRLAIEQLQSQLPFDKQPAQILKQVPKLTIFTDQPVETSK